MAKCAGCGTMILFGGESNGGERFCNKDCLQNSLVQHVASQIPADMLDATVEDIHQGDCPQCGGTGPVDLHTSHRAWSALYLTSWSSHPMVCCRSCAIANHLKSIAFTTALGWWGIPWGLIATPIQVTRNVFSLFSLPVPDQPSAALRDHVLAMIAIQSQQPTKPRRRNKRVEPIFDESLGE